MQNGVLCRLREGGQSLAFPFRAAEGLEPASPKALQAFLIWYGMKE